MSYFIGQAQFAKNVGLYIKNELTNDDTIQKVNNPVYDPRNLFKKGFYKTTYASSIGAGKYLYDNKLDKRQRKQVQKWGKLVNPNPKVEVKKPFFSSFFKPKTKPVTPPVTPTVTKS